MEVATQGWKHESIDEYFLFRSISSNIRGIAIELHAHCRIYCLQLQLLSLSEITTYA